MYLVLLALVSVLGVASSRTSKKPKTSPPSPLDLYLEQVERRSETVTPASSPGSLFSPSARLGDAFRDTRASQVDDVITILVSDRATALSKGTTNTSRKASVKAGVQSIAGLTKAAGPLANLAGATGDQQLQGQGATTRDSLLTTTLSARVTHVLPNGNLVVEGVKNLAVNSEHQSIAVRGIIRPQDLTSVNTVVSDRLANLEIRVDGKGVVADSVRRPFILYRILMGLLPI